jgi:hypothetical protein
MGNFLQTGPTGGPRLIFFQGYRDRLGLWFGNTARGSEHRRCTQNADARRTIVRRWAEVMAGQLNSTGEGSVEPVGANDNVPLPVEDAVRLP